MDFGCIHVLCLLFHDSKTLSATFFSRAGESVACHLTNSDRRIGPSISAFAICSHRVRLHFGLGGYFKFVASHASFGILFPSRRFRPKQVHVDFPTAMEQVASLRYQRVDPLSATADAAAHLEQPISDSAKPDAVLSSTGDRSIERSIERHAKIDHSDPTQHDCEPSRRRPAADSPGVVLAEGTCGLCLDAAADAVLVECGHGGLCAGPARRPAACAAVLRCGSGVGQKSRMR